MKKLEFVHTERAASEMLNSIEYRKLLSPCNIEESDVSHLAVDDLKFALEQGDSRNVAITGRLYS